MRLENWKLWLKMLLPILLMSCIVAGLMGFAIFELLSISSAASEVIEKRDAGAVAISRAARNLVQLGYDTFGNISFASDEPAGVAADADYAVAIAQTKELLDEARGRRRRSRRPRSPSSSDRRSPRSRRGANSSPTISRRSARPLG